MPKINKKEYQKVFDVLEYNEVDIIGSANDTNLKYFADIDTQEFIKTKKTYSEILSFFQEKYTNLIEMKNVYVTDFKAGFYSGKPLKWNYTDLMNGYKTITEHIHIDFEEALTQKSIIKIDIIIDLNEQLIEMSTNYYFDFKGRNTTTPIGIDNPIKKLLYDYKEQKNVNFYRALKRLYSYYQFIDDEPNQNKLLKIFNSGIGYINKQLSGLKTIQLLVKNDNKPKKDRLMKEVKKIVNNFTSVGIHIDITDKYFNSKLNKAIEFLSDKLNTIITKRMMKPDMKNVLI